MTVASHSIEHMFYLLEKGLGAGRLLDKYINIPDHNLFARAVCQILNAGIQTEHKDGVLKVLTYFCQKIGVDFVHSLALSMRFFLEERKRSTSEVNETLVLLDFLLDKRTVVSDTEGNQFILNRDNLILEGIVNAIIENLKELERKGVASMDMTMTSKLLLRYWEKVEEKLPTCYVDIYLALKKSMHKVFDVDATKESLLGLLLYVNKSILITDTMCYASFKEDEPTQDKDLQTKTEVEVELPVRKTPFKQVAVAPALETISEGITDIELSNKEGSEEDSEASTDATVMEKDSKQDILNETIMEDTGIFLGDKIIKFGGNDFVKFVPKPVVTSSIPPEPEVKSPPEPPIQSELPLKPEDEKLNRSLGEIIVETSRLDIDSSNPLSSPSPALDRTAKESDSAANPVALSDEEEVVLGYVVLEDGSKVRIKDHSAIGRSDECQVFLNNIKVSHKHAIIKKTGDIVVIVPVSAKKGLAVNDRKVVFGEEVALKDKDVIIIGKVVLAWEMPAKRNKNPVPLSLINMEDYVRKTPKKDKISPIEDNITSKEDNKNPKNDKKTLMADKKIQKDKMKVVLEEKGNVSDGVDGEKIEGEVANNKKKGTVKKLKSKDIKDAHETFELEGIAAVKVRRSRISQPKKIPQIKVTRDGGVGSFRTRLGLTLPLVSAHPVTENKLTGQTEVIDAHALSHRKLPTPDSSSDSSDSD